jgi:beta-D-xylosidase 4
MAVKSRALLPEMRAVFFGVRFLVICVVLLCVSVTKTSASLGGGRGREAIKQQPQQYACDPKGNPALRGLPFCDTSLTDAERVEDLISRLTVQEKITQLVSTAFNVSRLGIPAYEWWGEGLHGVAISPSVDFGGDVAAATSFPQPILTAGSFNTALWNSIGQASDT